MKLIVEISDEIACKFEDVKEEVHESLYYSLYGATREHITVTELGPQTQDYIELGKAVRAIEYEYDQLANIAWHEHCNCGIPHEKSMNTQEILVWNDERQKGGGDNEQSQNDLFENQ
jgi:hypothetical protein